MPALVEHIITKLPKQARSPLVPPLHSGYRTSSVISTACSSFGEGVVEVIDRVIDLAPLPQLARNALKAVTRTVASVAGSVWSFFFR